MRRRKLNPGNFPSWEERIDYQLHCALEKGHDLRATDLELYSKVGELQGRADTAARAADVQRLWRLVGWLAGILGGVCAVVLALVVFAIWSVVS